MLGLFIVFFSYQSFEGKNEELRERDVIHSY